LKNLRERPLGRCRHRWKDNIKTAIKETGSKDVDWIHLAQGRNPCFCECGDELWVSIKGGEFTDQLSDYQFFYKNSSLWG
jgi:hypothetical protein